MLSSKIPTLYSFPDKYVSTNEGEFCSTFMSSTLATKLSKLSTIEFLSIPLLSPPVTGFIKRGNFIGINVSSNYSPGLVIKKSAVLILAFCISFLARFLLLSLSNAALLEAMYGMSNISK